MGPDRHAPTGRAAAIALLCGCAGTADPTPMLGETVQVVPGEGLPAEVDPQPANNNLDVAWHDGRLFLAFRTAPSHFASTETVLYVVSSADQQSWTFEASFEQGTDLREPRLLAWDGRLFLYYAVLGEDATDFEPRGAMGSERLGPASWTEPAAVFPEGFIPWRARVEQGQPRVIGYTGGANIYDGTGEPVSIWWLTSADGWTWEGVVPESPIVLEGGGSETDWALLEDGGLVAVVRNEAGDEDGFGSKICRAEPGALADWTCEADPKKYDSPLVFEHSGQVWLVARRNVTETGNYDLGYDDLSATAQSVAYALDYWEQPKRCAIWRVDPDELAVTHVADLPSRGDTCFPAIWHAGPHRSFLYNYSSPIDGEDLSWLEGQGGETRIYRTILEWPAGD